MRERTGVAVALLVVSAVSTGMLDLRQVFQEPTAAFSVGVRGASGGVTWTFTCQAEAPCTMPAPAAGRGVTVYHNGQSHTVLGTE